MPMTKFRTKHISLPESLEATSNCSVYVNHELESTFLTLLNFKNKHPDFKGKAHILG